MKIRAIIVSTSTRGYYNKDVYFCFWCVHVVLLEEAMNLLNQSELKKIIVI